MKTDNRTNGGRFEQELSHILAEHGFWVHVMQQNRAGQPADIIAAKGKYHTLIDCKVVSDGNGFLFRRVEENQRLAMKRFTERCKWACWFAIKLPDESIYMLSYPYLMSLEKEGQKSISEKEIREELWDLDGLLKEMDKLSKKR